MCVGVGWRARQVPCLRVRGRARQLLSCVGMGGGLASVVYFKHRRLFKQLIDKVLFRNPLTSSMVNM